MVLMKISTKTYSTAAGLSYFLVMALPWNLLFHFMLTFDTTLSYNSWYRGLAIPLTFVIHNALIGTVSVITGISIYRRSRRLLVVSVLCLLFVIAELILTLEYYQNIVDFLTS
jgi:hypothetical protein